MTPRRLILYAGLVLAIVILWPGDGGTPSVPRYSPPPEPEPAVVLSDGTRIEWIEAIARCRVEVQNSLLAPSTASFPSVGRPSLENNTWRHTVTVDAQNAFGAMIRSSFSCVIDGDAGTIEVRENN